MKFKEIIVRTINTVDKTYVDSNGDIQPFQPLEIYLVPIPSTTEHDRYVVDNNGTISKQAKGGGDFIPLTGTAVGKPFDGTLEVTPNSIITMKKVDGDTDSVIRFTDSEGLRLDSNKNNGEEYSILNIKPDKTEIHTFLQGGADQTSFTFSENGLTSNKDFNGISHNYLDYVQKGYVDGKFFQIDLDNISLAGTKPDKPLTGNVEMDSSRIVKFYSGSSSTDDRRSIEFYGSSQLLFKNMANQSSGEGSDISLFQNQILMQAYNPDYPNYKDSVGSFINMSHYGLNFYYTMGNNAHTNNSLQINDTGIVLSSYKDSLNTSVSLVPGSGLVGSSDFRDNYTPYSFVQKQYVDDIINDLNSSFPDSEDFPDYIVEVPQG